MILRPLALVLLLAAAAPAQFIYALNTHGKLTLNGTLLDSLPTTFDASTGMNPLEQWVGLAVHGPDRYAVRLDGRVQKNGVKLFQLAPVSSPVAIFAWTDIVVDSTGGVHMLRQDGERALDGNAVVTYPLGSNPVIFLRLAVSASGAAFALRDDGAVFTGTSTQVAGVFPITGNFDPTDPHKVWLDLAVDELNQLLLALRADGNVFKIAIPDLGGANPPTAVEHAVLPFPASPTGADIYTRLAVANGSWRVLQADGALFSPDSVVEPQVDYAGAGVDSDSKFFWLTWDGTDVHALRGDGAVFENLDDSNSLFNLIGNSYGSLAIGAEPPDLSKFKNPPPKAAPYKLQVPENTAASLPILVSDIEKLADDLTVTENPDKPLPLGATFSEVDDGFGHKTRTIEWDGTQPVGVYKCPLMVTDDALGHKPVKFVETIKVVALDSNPLNKNKPPKALKPKPVQALVDHEVRIPVFGVDLDGDPLTFSVNPEKEPYKTLGATFDTDTNEFVWTPTFDDIGTIHPKIQVTDGTHTVSFTLGIKVVNSLIFE